MYVATAGGSFHHNFGPFSMRPGVPEKRQAADGVLPDTIVMSQLTPFQARRPSLSTLAFYDQAIRTLWIQVVALSVAGAVGMASAISLEPRLGGGGLDTPILPLSVAVSEARGLSAIYLANGGT